MMQALQSFSVSNGQAFCFRAIVGCWSISYFMRKELEHDVLTVDKFARAVRGQIEVHFVVLHQHLAHVVKGHGMDLMARAVDMPRDGVRRANIVVVRSSRGRASITG